MLEALRRNFWSQTQNSTDMYWPMLVPLWTEQEQIHHHENQENQSSTQISPNTLSFCNSRVKTICDSLALKKTGLLRVLKNANPDLRRLPQLKIRSSVVWMGEVCFTRNGLCDGAAHEWTTADDKVRCHQGTIPASCWRLWMRTKALCSWLALNYGRTARTRTNLPKNLPELDLAPWLLYLLSGPKLCIAGGLPYDFTILHLSDSFRLFQLSIGFPLDFHWISIGFPLDFHWISIGFPLDFHWISMLYFHCRRQRKSSGKHFALPPMTCSRCPATPWGPWRPWGKVEVLWQYMVCNVCSIELVDRLHM